MLMNIEKKHSHKELFEKKLLISERVSFRITTIRVLYNCLVPKDPYLKKQRLSCNEVSDK